VIKPMPRAQAPDLLQRSGGGAYAGRAWERGQALEDGGSFRVKHGRRDGRWPTPANRGRAPRNPSAARSRTSSLPQSLVRTEKGHHRRLYYVSILLCALCGVFNEPCDLRSLVYRFWCQSPPPAI
jgi:hypothetical protein